VSGDWHVYDDRGHAGRRAKKNTFSTEYLYANGRNGCKYSPAQE